MNYRWKPTMPQLAVFISLVGLLILLSGNALQPAAAQTTLPRFNLVENAVLLEDRLRLTIDQPDQSGAAWLVEKQQVQNGFEATFDWQITKTSQQGGDGFAFVIHNAHLPFPGWRWVVGKTAWAIAAFPTALLSNSTP
jgi:hypothetical protein